MINNAIKLVGVVILSTFMFIQSCDECSDDTCYECTHPDMPDCITVICNEVVTYPANCNNGTSISTGSSGKCNADLKKIEEDKGYECVKR